MAELFLNPLINRGWVNYSACWGQAFPQRLSLVMAAPIACPQFARRVPVVNGNNLKIILLN